MKSKREKNLPQTKHVSFDSKKKCYLRDSIMTRCFFPPLYFPPLSTHFFFGMEELMLLDTLYHARLCRMSESLWEQAREQPNRGAFICIVPSLKEFLTESSLSLTWGTRRMLEVMMYPPALDAVDSYDPEVSVVIVVRMKSSTKAYVLNKDDHLSVSSEERDAMFRDFIKNGYGEIRSHCAHCGVSNSESKLLACSACQTAKYCGCVCQNEDWHKHRELCQSYAKLRLDMKTALD